MTKLEMDTSELKKLVEKINAAPETLREAKRKAFQQAAPQIKQALDAQIGGTGKVQSWQAAFVGSKGGYAAVRPKAKTFAENSKGGPTKYAVGYVTNAIENGHRFPRSGKTRSSGIVFGRYYYQKTQRYAEKIAQQSVEQIVEALQQHLEG